MLFNSPVPGQKLATKVSKSRAISPYVPGVNPGMAADKCIKAKKLYSSLRIYTHKNTFSSQICLKTFSMFYNIGI